ncbi:hypothetical protein L3X38_022518 [Prunus dulcis]|uniref:GAG-pre-integrase domain-containing protein n=1 Tax=Prunus dulcis TaxID=3755 RepID=A0AAD4VXS5_PRUDU|nr:hypothetical protein L3X38_022518 [Prunus dulcis]
MLGSGTKIGEPAVVFASKNTALVSQHTGFGSSAVPPRRLIYAEKDKLKCDHCGEKRHTIDTCWALHGVPDWEKERRRLKKEQLDSKAHVVVAPTSVADITTGHDHLTTTPLSTLTTVSRTPTPSPPDKVLLVSFLSSNLLSVPQVTEQLNCVILMYPFFVLLQDIQTREIFGRDTKKGGLYYVDDVATSRVLRAGSAKTSQHCRIWLLHYRFGHASFGYLRHLFPALFSGVNKSAFQCQTYILAKSHRILAATHALLLGASVPKRFWMDAVTYAVYLLNLLS